MCVSTACFFSSARLIARRITAAPVVLSGARISPPSDVLYATKIYTPPLINAYSV